MIVLTMKSVHILGILLIAIALVFCAGCTNSQSAPPQTSPGTPAPTQIPVAAIIATPIPTATPFPNTLAMNQKATFGKTDRTGTATVYKINLVPDYSYSDPTFNSPHEQPQAGNPLSTQTGYNTQKPTTGNAYLFVYIRVVNTGAKALLAPSPEQFVVNYDGNFYSYNSIISSKVTLGNIPVPQYDYAIGPGGVAGFINPGDSNAADGYLIYQVPASIDLTRASLVAQLDSENRDAWALA
jgi:hypothetical protein